MTQDIRWKQRLQNYSFALNNLKEAVELSKKRDLSKLEKQGLIQSFEFTHELSWNVMRDYFKFQGNMQITGSRDAAREAFQKGLITNGDAWMEMIKSRNQTSHTYNQKIADEITGKICNSYFKEFVAFESTMQELSKSE